MVAALALFGPGIVAADQAVDTTDQTFDFFLQEAKVVSASRREQNKSDSPVAIEVITHDDIVASGAFPEPGGAAALPGGRGRGRRHPAGG